MKNGWTGGQYSLYRAIFGAYLLVHFVSLLPWAAELFSIRGVPPADASPLLRLFPNVLAVNASPLMAQALVAMAAIASLFFALGLYDRAAALIAWYALACLFGRNPLTANPSLPFAGWLLLAHCATPAVPYGSWRARGRSDPDGGWRMAPLLFAAAWIVMSAGYSYSGYTKLVSPSWVDGSALERVLANPLARPTFLRDWILAGPELPLRLATWGALGLELLFAPVALIPRARPWIWSAMLLLHIGLMILIDFADLSFGMVILHLFTLDPAWIAPRRSERPDKVLYDGTCALCHGAVRFILAEDRSGAFRFAPLPGRATPGIPDSIVVETGEEQLMRSDAVIHILRRLGGLWRVAAILLALIPRPVRDVAYDAIARVRYKIFGHAKSVCPLMPRDLRSRFES